MEADEGGSENPNTAVEKDEIKGSPTKRRKRHHRQQKFDIPGVHKLVLSELTQKIIGCVAGENVTVEKPWMYVEKELLRDNLGESSEFLPLKNDILQYSGEKVLVGYVPDETTDYDEFYVCVTETATATLKHTIEKIQRSQEEKLRNAINKKVKPWHSLRSEVEVEETIAKNNRPLIEIEVESKYPILPFKIHFRQTKSDDVRNGYMELRTIEETATSIYKKRVNCHIQVSPSLDCSEAQTKCTYPSNFATQYEYEVRQQASEECLKLMQNYFNRDNEFFFDLLRVNGAINFYADDYKNLIVNSQFTVRKPDVHPVEFTSFVNMGLCEGKQIAGITWHPTWTGIVVLSYVQTFPTAYIDYKVKDDEVNRAVHGTNPVLLWTFQDELNPKLIMEAPREVYSLSFCPFDENLLVGGMVNGQIVIWDLTNKLGKVEDEDVLTNEQYKYRNRIDSLMDWMKDMGNVNLVRPTAISDLKHSHRGCINTIKWMSPKHQVSKTGIITDVEDGESSTQLLSSAEDGTILIWDLRMKPATAPGGFKPIKKLRRLKRKPSALVAETSPYRPLHLALRPIFCIKVNHPLDNSRPLGISTFLSKFFTTSYERVINDKDVKHSPLAERIIYKVESIDTKTPIDSEVLVGTLEGDFIHGTWQGQEFDSGESVNHEECQFSTFSKYHDGPVVSLAYSPVMDLIITVGGKIFALWNTSVKNRPILWRKSKYYYTYGSFFRSDQMKLKLTTTEGHIEIWALFSKSKAPISSWLFSNGPISQVTTHPRIMKETVFGYGDYHGTFRLFLLPQSSGDEATRLFGQFTNFIEREVEIKAEFSEWQQQWNKRYAEYINIRKENKKMKTKLQITRIEPVKEIGSIKKKEVRYLDWVKEQQHINSQQRLKRIILIKKQLDTEELEKQRIPLRKLEEENEAKKRRQRQKLKESDKIFQDTVAMFFPDLVKAKPELPADPYVCHEFSEELDKCYKEFRQISVEAQDFVEEHPFKYDFDWNRVITFNRNRRRHFEKSGHFERHERYKMERNSMTARVMSSENVDNHKICDETLIKEETIDLI